ncbi:MAG TPA: hypothetical protein VJR89_31165 [Polyangiales bacterium]|nr:hypothetical protein [Polyangiales bacterium]
MRSVTHAIVANVVLAGLLGSARVEAQPSQHALGFSIDAGLSGNRDDLLVPRMSSGPRLALGPSYDGQLGPGALHVELHVAVAYVLDRDGYPGVAFDHALDAYYVFELGSAFGMRHALGPALGLDADIAGLVSWDDAHAYWIGTRWLGVAWRAHVAAWRGARWDFAAELPVVGLASRPDSYRHNKQDALNHVSFYFAEVYEDPQAVWWAQLQQLRLSVDLWHSASSGFVVSGWALGAEVRVAHAAEPGSALAYRTTLRFRAAWGL